MSLLSCNESRLLRLLAVPVFEQQPCAGTGGATSVAAGRISYMFGLKGACLSIDTACSSSLVGAHYASRDIAAADCDRALAAGVNLTLSPGKTSAFAITGSPLPSCLCCPCCSHPNLVNDIKYP